VVTSPEPLTPASFDRAVEELASRDPDIAGIVARFGPPPMWDRPAGFETLAHIILEQQVSLASARAAMDRLLSAADPLTPTRFLELDDGELLAIGFSRQKARYVRILAGEVASGRLDLDVVSRLDDDAASAALTAITGIGPWTATIYLLMVLRRPDVWPAGDIALAQAVAEAKGLPARPGSIEMEALGEAWRPWRSVAARLFWHDYLSRRGRS